MGLDIFTQRIPLLIVENLNCLCHYHWVRTGYTVAYVAGPSLFRSITANELSSDVARFTVHELTCIATNQVVAGSEKLFQKAESSSPL